MVTTPFPPLSSFQRRLESRKAGRGVRGWQGLADGALSCHARVLSFPLCGNGLSKSLDSGLRRNDEGAAGMTTNSFRLPSSFQRKLACIHAAAPINNEVATITAGAAGHRQRAVLASGALHWPIFC